MDHSVAPMGQSFKHTGMCSPTVRFGNKIGGLLKKSIYDHGRFLPHFDALETPPPPRSSDVDDDTSPITRNIVERVVYALLLSEALRRGCQPHTRPARPPDAAVVLTVHDLPLVAGRVALLRVAPPSGESACNPIRAYARTRNWDSINTHNAKLAIEHPRCAPLPLSYPLFSTLSCTRRSAHPPGILFNPLSPLTSSSSASASCPRPLWRSHYPRHLTRAHTSW